MKSIKEIIASHRSVICLDGNAFNSDILALIKTSAVIIAADGAANWTESEGLKPHYIVGDCDSVSPNRQHNNIPKIHIADQDTTDFEKCIHFAQENYLLPSLVLGFNGGEIDHILGNILTLMKYSDDISLFFVDNYQKRGKPGIKVGIPLSAGEHHLVTGINTTISIIPFTSSELTTKGLVWELDDQILEQVKNLAIRNRSSKEDVQLQIKSGKILFIMELSL